MILSRFSYVCLSIYPLKSGLSSRGTKFYHNTYFSLKQFGIENRFITNEVNNFRELPVRRTVYTINTNQMHLRERNLERKRTKF